VKITVPRDRDGSFELKIVKKRQKRLTGVDEMVISSAAKGLTTGEARAHLAEVYGVDVSRQAISTFRAHVGLDQGGVGARLRPVCRRERLVLPGILLTGV
jgi:transposase-like protein